MGQNILTPKQLEFLELTQVEPEVTKRFYLTGGTALSAFYLQHRSTQTYTLSCKKYDYPLGKLVLDAKAKFDWDIDKVTLASQFIKVRDLDESSSVLVPFNKGEMEDFFLKQAKLLEGDIFK